jgi:translocation and assembly module TamB
MALAGVERGPEAGVLGRLRDGFGLDRLDVDSDARGSTILEGGRYLMDGLFIGARQDDQGTESRGILRMDIIPRLRLEADLGDGGGVRGGTAFEIEY